MDVSDELLRTADLSALVTADGVIRHLSTAMAAALGGSVDACIGHELAGLLSKDQTIAAERLLALGAMGEQPAMGVLVFPGHDASLACLFKARPVRCGNKGEQLVLICAVPAEDDVADVLIPFQMAAEAADVGLWMYSPSDRQLRWVGGGPGFAAFSPKPTISLSWVIARVHRDDHEALRRLMRPRASVQSPVIELRVFSHDEVWHYLACQTRRVELGQGGPTVTFAMVRDETEQRRLADVAEESLRRAGSQQLRVELAIEFQKRMLPRVDQDISGVDVECRYRPCQDGLEIGGDWYGAFTLPDGAVSLDIGDVQGHDTAAAAVMGKICASLRAIAEHEPAPGTVLARVNELLIKTGEARFATCTMLHVDPDTGNVIGTTAGHVPVLRVHKDGRCDVLSLSGGPVLGVVPDVEYPEEAFVLDEDSAIVMVTDGVVEGPDLTLDDGLQRTGKAAADALRQGLSSNAIARRVLETAKGLGHLDDAAVLVMRRP